MQSVRITLAALLVIGTVPAEAQIRPRPGEPGPTRTPVVPQQVPRPKTACVASAKGSAPTILSVVPKGPWATTITWSSPVWATGHYIARATTPNGPFVTIATDSSKPAPPQSTTTTTTTGTTNVSPNVARIAGERVLTQATPSRAIDAGMTEREHTSSDMATAPQTTYYYRVTAQYRKPGAECPDSADAGSATSAAVTTPYANIMNFTAEAVGDRHVHLSWDEPPRSADYVFVRRNKVPIPAPQFVLKDGKRTLVDETPVNAAAPPLYEVQAVYGNVSIHAAGVATVPKLWGFADLHVHQFADLGFGGIGIPTVPSGQVDLAGLKRAYEAGLRLIVMQAVNTELFCRAASAPAEVISSVLPGANVPKPPLPCDDAGAIDRQIAAAKALESSSGGWYDIVYTAAEARRAIGAGRLAVVLGVEVDNFLDCRANGPGACTPDQVAPRLAALHLKGVRQVIPIHLSDNGFGGHALYHDLFFFNNKFLTGSFPAIRECSSEGFQYRFRIASDATSWARNNFGDLGALAIAPLTSGLPASPANAWCNAKGLNPLGEILINELMSKKMLIDIDHLSALAADRTMQFAMQQRYPVLTSHSGFLDASVGAKRAEGQQTASRLAMIRQLGGVVGAIVDQGTTDGIASLGGAAGALGTVDNTCSNSSRTWAQAYLLAAQSGPVAFGSDFNGAPKMGGRFGAAGCENRPAEVARQDPASRVPDQVHAIRMFGPDAPVSPRASLGLPDFNEVGLAHIGLYPEFIADLRNVGVTRAGLEPLFRSADAYVTMWERIELRGMTP